MLADSRESGKGVELERLKELREQPQSALWHSVQGQHQPPTHRVAPEAYPETSVRVLHLDSQIASSDLWPRKSGGGEPASSYEDKSKMTSKRKPFQTQLRRSISEQLRDSTARAWDLLWKNVRRRRSRNPVACSGPQSS